MNAHKEITHDMILYALLLNKARSIDADVREGKMFGCPAIYHGKKMALCVMGSSIGLKVPKDVANEARERNDIGYFQPYGKPAMREWIELAGTEAAMEKHSELILEAILYAERLNGK